jgi:hypothetical protein
MALSECVLQSAQFALSTAARNARRFRSPTYSALIVSLLYEELNNELRGTETDDVDKRDLLIQAIQCCRDIARSFPAETVDALRVVLQLLETGRLPQADVIPEDRRAQFRVVQGKLSSLSNPIAYSSQRQLREIG